MSVYAISDLHGRYDLYQEVKKFLKPEDRVFCLGDCGDRGPDGWKLIKTVYEDPQFIYLMGNHEHMLIGAMCEEIGDHRIENIKSMYYNQNMAALVYVNGGHTTFRGWTCEGSDPKWIDNLLSLSYKEVYTNKDGVKIILTHAGYNPSMGNGYKFDLLWNRSHFHRKWDAGDDEIIVHGHTPCIYLAEEYNIIDSWKPADGAVWYADNHKVDIDVGACFTGVTCLLDLDTFDEHYFSI